MCVIWVLPAYFVHEVMVLQQLTCAATLVAVILLSTCQHYVSVQ